MLAALVFALVIAPSVTPAALLTADRLRGFTVQSAEGAEVGKVVAILVDLAEGRVGYLLVAPAGEGDRRIVIPWLATEILPATQAVRLRIDAERFERTPFEAQDVTDRERGRAIHRYFGVSPYWEMDKAPRAPSAPHNLRIVH